MPLECDCYDGCWGDHSADWPRVGGRVERRRVEELIQKGLVPYGCYVSFEDHIRVDPACWEAVKSHLGTRVRGYDG